MGKIEGGPQGHQSGEAQRPANSSTGCRVITGAELAGRKVANHLWKDARFLLEWKDREGRLHTAGNYRITRGRPDGSTETVRYLEEPTLRDAYAENFRGEALLPHGGESGAAEVDVYELGLRGNRRRRRQAYDAFIGAARHDGYSIRRCEIELPSEASSDEGIFSVRFFVQRPRT